MLNKTIDMLTAKAKLTGLVVAAAALGGTFVASGGFVPVADEEVVVEVSTTPEATPDATPDATPEATPEATPDAAEVAVVAVSPAPCPTDVKNHGQYVSSVARDKTLKGRDHGKAVSAAAQSDCGKKAADEAEESEESEESADDVEETDEAKAARKAAKAERKAAKRQSKSQQTG